MKREVVVERSVRKSAATISLLNADKTPRLTTDRNALITTQTNVAAQAPINSVRRTDAAATEREIPVPSATYAAKHAGHFGSKARTSVGSEHFTQARRRLATDGGCALPSAAL